MTGRPQQQLLTHSCSQLIRGYVEETRKGYKQGSKPSEHPTIFHALLDSDLPAEEITTRRLTHEAVTVVTAGSTTTSVHLSRTTFELLSNPSKLETLRNELSAAEKEHGSPLTLPHLEQLPYLGAVITEGLRLTYGKPRPFPHQKEKIQH